MEKFITDERTGLTYELVGDYYLVAGGEEPEVESIGIYGQRHRRYLRQNRRCRYNYLFMTGQLDTHLREIDHAANEMFTQLTKQMVAAEGVTEASKTANQMEWVRYMNNIQNRAREIVNSKLIYNRTNPEYRLPFRPVLRVLFVWKYCGIGLTSNGFAGANPA